MGRIRGMGCLGCVALFVVCAIWQILEGPLYWLLVTCFVVTSVAEVTHIVANVLATRDRNRAARAKAGGPAPPITPS
jgi:hypothetical protein